MRAFADWYSACHGRSPLPWQTRMAAQVAANQTFPSWVSLPTGCGKTSVLAVWLWARAVGLAVPARLAYLVDRRLVVDSIADYAQRLAAALPPAERPLVARMRGGITQDDAWVRDPTQTAILVSTVDQVGSRLLFRGYGVSAQAAPIHAGLLGEDCLIVLDEAHLSAAFSATLARIAAAPRQLGLPWQVVQMSATPPPAVAAFALDDADRADPRIAARLCASKPAQLLAVPAAEFAVRCVAVARHLRADGAAVIGVVVNRVDDARAVFEALCAEGDACLLTGRIRPADRDALVAELLPRIEVGSRAAGRAPLFVVATQTIEVGADLDFDALVTESASCTALCQRFGRLNRLGELARSPAVIVHRTRVEGQRADPVYGDALPRTWRWLTAVAERKQVDFGIDALARLAEAPPAPEAETPPVLTPTLIEALSFTSPRVPVDIAPYLHGWRNSADVYLLWRADLGEPGDWAAAVADAPPLAQEMLPLPVYEAREWLRALGDGQLALRWDGDAGALVGADDLRPGDVLVVPSAYGGSDRYGWTRAARAPVTDLGDAHDGERIRVRLNPALYDGDAAERLRALLAADPPRLADAVAFAGLPAGRRYVLRAGATGLLIESGIWQVERAQRRAVALDAHLAGVSAWGSRFAARLAPQLQAAVVEACAAHDVGKADPRFQLMLGAGRGPLLAKSALEPDLTARWRELAGLPAGWRHEIESVRRRPQAAPLVRYLIGTHHGFGRPWLPAAPDAALWAAVGGSDWPDLVADLSQRYGYWGLAYLSALVRLADWARSEEELAAAPTAVERAA